MIIASDDKTLATNPGLKINDVVCFTQFSIKLPFPNHCMSP